MIQKIKQKDIKTLIFAEYNPRQLTTDQYKHLKDSIDRFGFVDPVIVNKNKDRKNIIIGGHQRVKVATDMNISEVRCVEIDLTYERERELNIRLNRNTGEWDMDNLANFFDMEELIDWGFDEGELVFEDEEPIAGLVDDDEIPEVEEAVTKLGDLWLLGEHRLLCGDSTKKENIELLMDGQKADMVFTDPPYGVDYEGGSKEREKLKDDHTGTEVYSKMIGLIPNYCIGAFYIWYADRSSVDVFLSLKDKGVIHSVLIWVKNNSTFNMNLHYKAKHEGCIYWKPLKNKLFWNGDSKQETVLNFDRENANKLHPTQKPVELCAKIINNHKADIVLDPFLGSGSTLIACEKTNRKCYGMELDPHYCDVIVKRWENFTGKKATLDGYKEEISRQTQEA